MSYHTPWSARRARFLNRFHARRAARATPQTGFTLQPEPRTIGSFGRGRQLIAGNFLFAGHLVQAPGSSIWDITPPTDDFAAVLAGFSWMDDLAAVADHAARKRAHDWTLGWIERYGGGRGPGWTPDLTGRRLIRWINHAILITGGQDSAETQAVSLSLARQTLFLSRRWHSAPPGLPRFEALTGLIHAGLSLNGMEAHVEPAMRGLAQECALRIDEAGGLPNRNPEDLLEVFTLLNWASAALSESGRMAAPEHLSAISRIAPTLRALRHADGGLARFHGGGRGAEGRLDQALATSGVRAGSPHPLAMGFARLQAGRTTVIVDAARPPTGDASSDGHASTLAMEVTSGRRPLVVNCGSGATFGDEWRKAGRATPSHSTLGLTGYSSSRLGPTRRTPDGPRALLLDTPGEVRIEFTQGDDNSGLMSAHDGYVQGHGLRHMRELHLSNDGRMIRGEDVLAAVDADDRDNFVHAKTRERVEAIPYTVRFHLHPDVDARLDLGGTAVSMALKSGEMWIFRSDGPVKMTLERSVYLEKGRLKPRATKQVVLSGAAMDYATRIRWSLAKAQDTPSAIRDLERDEPAGLPD